MIKRTPVITIPTTFLIILEFSHEMPLTAFRTPLLMFQILCATTQPHLPCSIPEVRDKHLT
jgi:hypothetical protein